MSHRWLLKFWLRKTHFLPCFLFKTHETQNHPNLKAAKYHFNHFHYFWIFAQILHCQQIWRQKLCDLLIWKSLTALKKEMNVKLLQQTVGSKLIHCQKLSGQAKHIKKKIRPVSNLKSWYASNIKKKQTFFQQKSHTCEVGGKQPSKRAPLFVILLLYPLTT